MLDKNLVVLGTEHLLLHCVVSLSKVLYPHCLMQVTNQENDTKLSLIVDKQYLKRRY